MVYFLRHDGLLARRIVVKTRHRRTSYYCFSYFVCFLYSIWRTVDPLVQIALTREYEEESLITAENALTLLKKQTEIG